MKEEFRQKSARAKPRALLAKALPAAKAQLILLCDLQYLERYGPQGLADNGFCNASRVLLALGIEDFYLEEEGNQGRAGDEKDTRQRLAAFRAVPLTHLYLYEIHLSLVQPLAGLGDGYTDCIILGLDISDQPGTLQQDVEVGHPGGVRGLII
jgi:hypothetical protein